MLSSGPQPLASSRRAFPGVQPLHGIRATAVAWSVARNSTKRRVCFVMLRELKRKKPAREVPAIRSRSVSAVLPSPPTPGSFCLGFLNTVYICLLGRHEKPTLVQRSRTPNALFSAPRLRMLSLMLALPQTFAMLEDTLTGEAELSTESRYTAYCQHVRNPSIIRMSCRNATQQSHHFLQKSRCKSYGCMRRQTAGAFPGIRGRWT